MPQPHRPAATTKQYLSVPGKCDPGHRTLVAVKRCGFLKGSEIPKFNRPIVTAGSERPAIARKCHIPNSAGVAAQKSNIAPRAIPYTYRAIPTGAGKHFSIRRPGHTIKAHIVSEQHHRWNRPAGVPYRQLSGYPGYDKIFSIRGKRCGAGRAISRQLEKGM